MTRFRRSQAGRQRHGDAGHVQPPFPHAGHDADEHAAQRYRSAERQPVHYQKPYSGITLIENWRRVYRRCDGVVELFINLRLRLGFNHLRTQGHLVTTDDAGTTSHPSNIDRNNAANRVPPIGVVTPQTCNANRVDLSCPMDWNSAYRAVINQPGRRYRIDDINTLGGTAQLQGYMIGRGQRVSSATLRSRSTVSRTSQAIPALESTRRPAARLQRHIVDHATALFALASFDGLDAPA